ncbi:MAG: nucleoside kinase, partial [Chloroflexi bacterium]
MRELFVLTGASGTGKSTIGDELLGQIEDPVVLETDILWAPEMNTPQDGYARFRSTWMRLAVNIAQSGR